MTTRNTGRRATNQRSSLKSSGPVTPAGKAKMRNNALRHGLTSKHVVIDGEDHAEYEALRQDLLEECNPATPQEAQLVIEIAQGSWRLQRARRVEVQMFEMNMQDNPDCDAALAECFHANGLEFDKLRRYTTTIERCYYRALTELSKLQNERNKSEFGSVSQNRPRLPSPPANSVLSLCNTPPEPTENGSDSQIPGDLQ